ncbi:hypothetical protein [Gloeomargarita sp.]
MNKPAFMSWEAPLMVQRWTDEMLDKQAEENARAFRELQELMSRLEQQVAANTQAINELREEQAMMMQREFQVNNDVAW